MTGNDGRDRADLLTLAMRRAHAEMVEGREPEPPPDDRDASAADVADGDGGAVGKPLLVDPPT